MSLARPMVAKGVVMDDKLYTGDILASGVVLSAGTITTVGAGTLTGAAIGSGVITRTGPTAGYTDTTDTAANIVAALAGNASEVDMVEGLKFELLYINTVASAMTLAAGVGVTLGTLGSNTTGVSASAVRKYLVALINVDGPYTIPCSFTTTTKVITFILPQGMSSLPIGPSPQAVNITEKMTVSGTNIATNTKVVGVTAGIGGNTGVTVDTNTTGTQTNSAVTFGPTVEFDSLYQASL